MLEQHTEFLAKSQKCYKGQMKDRQKPLCQRYLEEPQTAVVIDSARTSSSNVDPTYPLGTAVRFCDESPVTMPVGVHAAVGGDSDYPTPGDILCGAIASCLDSTMRVVSNRVGVQLKKLDVAVTGAVDVRGTLRVNSEVPVAFTSFDVRVSVKTRGFVPGKMLDKLVRAAEQSCIIIQTLRNGPKITVTRVGAV